MFNSEDKENSSKNSNFQRKNFREKSTNNGLDKSSYILAESMLGKSKNGINQFEEVEIPSFSELRKMVKRQRNNEEE